MEMSDLVKWLDVLQVELRQTRIPEDQHPLIMGSAAGVIIALTRGR